jgi:endonuclease-3
MPRRGSDRSRGQIQSLLDEITRREGALDLSHLRGLPDDEVERYLTSLPGVARKTALCVMLYALDRATLPVDTHVWRVARRLGLAPLRDWSERRARELEDGVAPHLRANLHVTLVAHGRAVCRARAPRCGECAIAGLCPSCTSS